MIEEHSHKSTGLRGVEVADTNICLIEGEKGNLFIRGYDIKDLARNSTYEEVVYLLLYGKLPSFDQLKVFESTIKSNQELPPELLTHLQKTTKNTPSMSVLQSSLALLAGYDSEVEKETRETDRNIAIRIIALLPIIVTAWERIRNNKEPISPDKNLTYAANFLYMLHGKIPSEEEARMFDVTLVLHAEHSFNASTFTARVIASTGADLYASISGAIGSLSGKYHGGANHLVFESLLDIKKMSNVEKWVKDRFDKGKRVMGMGHAVYKTTDPRATILKEMASELVKSKGGLAQWMFETTNQMVDITQKEFKKRKNRDIHPNVDLYGSTVYTSLNIPVELFTPIFTTSRVAGWAAHVLEEKYPETPTIKPVIYRPSAEYIGRYCGPLGCEFTPITQRNTAANNDKLVKQIITQEITKVLSDHLIPVSLSARHIHLTETDFHKLFGEKGELHPLNSLSQHKQFACEEVVDLVGPKRAIYEVRVLGPFRDETQIEISRSDGYVLGINPPTRQSGDLEGTPGINVMGPKGAITLEKGVIFAARHIHMSPIDSQRLNVSDKQMVAVKFPGTRAGILDEVKVRVHPDYNLELHLDLDEGNALALNTGDMGRLISDFDEKSYSPFR
ncbi:MAG: phosphate propanoyltransferase [Candidatus Hodarchaeales archaeon]|jgi:citrate synthase